LVDDKKVSTFYLLLDLQVLKHWKKAGNPVRDDAVFKIPVWARW